MNRKFAVLIICFSAVLSHAMAAPPAGGGTGIEYLPAIRKPPVDRAEGDEALKKRQQSEKFGGFESRENASKGWDLMENSDFIAFGKDSTLLPKGAILHVPEKLLSHRIAKPTGRLMPWIDFVATYRGLVTYFDVTLEQASGQVAIAATSFEAAKRTGLIVVAVFNRNPVSVNPKALASVAPSR